MEQLSGLDAAFVHQDSRRTPMHVTALLIYDVGKDGRDALSLQQLQALIQQRLSDFPLFRRKLLKVPMGMDTPYWVDAPSMQWDRHIGQSTLGKGADWHDLHQRLSTLHAARIHLSRPLWEMHLLHELRGLDGLPPTCQGLILKVHHAAIDGISLAAIINALHQVPEVGTAGVNIKQTAPSPWELWTRANLNSVSRQFKFAETMSNILPGMLRARRSRREFGDLPVIRRSAAHFNGAVREGRSTGSLLMPRSQILAIKRAVRRVTLNDIAMSVVAGALRQYLSESGELPGKSLAAGVPINLRHSDEENPGGNRIATMIAGLATQEEDPVARVRLIHQYAVAGKRQIDALGTGTIMDISDSLSPALLAEGIKGMARASRLVDMPVPFHTMISNVPGPSAPLRLGKAELVVPLGLGPVRDNMGLFHIVSSSHSLLSIAFSACSRLLPDPDFYQDCLRESFEDLHAQALE
jgi:WS/DGAT/MGAT family acyltransferase